MNERHTSSREMVPSRTIGPHLPHQLARGECQASMMEMRNLQKYEYAISLCCVNEAFYFLLQAKTKAVYAAL